jgi:pimeloyl-ACP methyl ester carboxylesterase
LLSAFSRGEIMNIEAKGVRMNYETTGAGDWLVLIHGAGDNLQAWYNQVPVFSEQHKVLTYDTRGHGQTDVTEGEYTTGMWADDLRGLLEVLGVRRASVLGYSLGGMIAATLATEHPDMVDALVLAGIAGAAVGLGDRQTWEQRRKKQIELLDKEGMAGILSDRTDAATSTMFSPGFAEKNPQAINGYRERFAATSAGGYRKVLESMGRRGRPVDFSKILCPVLIIVGAFDLWSGPEAGKVLQERMPGSELVILPTGHACQIEQPGAFNEAVLSFLRRAGKGMAQGSQRIE